MNRKNFFKFLGVASFPLLFPLSIPAVRKTDNPKLIKPRRLKKGDTVALVAPAGPLTQKELDESVENMKKLGFNVVFREDILARNGYLAGTDERRAAEINEMFSRKDVDAIISARGGYGGSRILNRIDFELIKSNPKIFAGYSDITSLLYAINKKTGIVTFHSPVGISTFNDFSTEYFNQIFIEPSEKLILWSAKENSMQENKNLKIIRSGKAKGRLVGGNLSIVVSLIGTDYDIDTEGKIIFLEEVGEEPYRIDRMLTQMIQAGKFDKAAGIALGIFENCEPKRNQPESENSLSLLEVLYDRLYNLNLPVIYGLSFGHTLNKFTIPIGIEAMLDVNNQVLTLLETAVE